MGFDVGILCPLTLKRYLSVVKTEIHSRARLCICFLFLKFCGYFEATSSGLLSILLPQG